MNTTRPAIPKYCHLFQLSVVTFTTRNFRVFPSWYRLVERPQQGRGWDINWLGFEFVFEQLVESDNGFQALTLKKWKETHK